MANFVAVYDACVLYPAQLRDLLMRVALADLFKARWTDRIHDEWTRNLLANRADIQPEQLARVRRQLSWPPGDNYLGRSEAGVVWLLMAA